MTLGVPGKVILVILSSRGMCKIWLASGLINCRHTGLWDSHFSVDSSWGKKWVSDNLFLPPWTESSKSSRFPPRGHHGDTSVSPLDLDMSEPGHVLSLPSHQPCVSPQWPANLWTLAWAAANNKTLCGAAWVGTRGQREAGRVKRELPSPPTYLSLTP